MAYSFESAVSGDYAIEKTRQSATGRTDQMGSLGTICKRELLIGFVLLVAGQYCFVFRVF